MKLRASTVAYLLLGVSLGFVLGGVVALLEIGAPPLPGTYFVERCREAERP